ncbi:hypothetical protein Tco_1016186 [Tanacetum coccineum]|uniref:Uncharacterized protein n=1 Tax=Tanacetum coccineum TaxID=301880 RepID=A0ABQ5FMX5_9ASTR
MKKWKGRFFFINRRAIPDAMCWRHHDSDISDHAPKDGFDEADDIALAYQSIDIRGALDQTRRPFLNITNHYHLRDDDQVQAETVPQQKKNRGSEGASGPEGSSNRRKEKSSDHIPCPTPLQTIEAVTSDVSRGVLGNRDGNFDDDVDEEIDLEGPDRHTPMPDPLSKGAGADGVGSSLPPSLFVPSWGIHQRSRVTTPEECRDFEGQNLIHFHRESRVSFRAQLVFAQKEKTDAIRKLLPTVVGRLLQSHEYKQSLSIPFNYALQTGWGQGLAEERSEEELRKIMVRMNGFDPYSDKKMNAEYERLFSKTYLYVDRISHLSEKPVQDL